jgi:NAD(P)-dependent dehydrogenase (short-subunit alcohol dehydrogenase family)
MNNGPIDGVSTRIAIVTGGGSGIGRAIAERLATDGMNVAVFDRDNKSAETVAAKIQADGGTALGYAVDVSDRLRLEGVVDDVRNALGPATVLVNNAGVTGFEPFLKISIQTWNRLLDVNLTGTFHCCQTVLPDMIAARWGRIVNISSSGGQSGNPYMAHYVASKAGVIGLTKALALEFGPKGVTVNTIPPGFIDTPLLRAAESAGQLGEGVDFHAARTPVRRVGVPADIAAACSFLVREEAGYVNGQVFGVNGGRIT